MVQGRGRRAITLKQFQFLGSVHLLQYEEAWIMHIFHHQDFSLSLGMGMAPTKGAIMKPIAQRGLPMGANMTLTLPMVSKVTPIPGSGNKDMLPLELGTRTLVGCIQLLVPRRAISPILFQPPVHHRCNRRVDKQGQKGPQLLPLHSAQKMSWSI